MTGEEKFQVDLEGYLIIKNVLTDDEVAEMNDIIDNGERQGPPSLWGEPFKRLIDHPKILPYLLELFRHGGRTSDSIYPTVCPSATSNFVIRLYP